VTLFRAYLNELGHPRSEFQLMQRREVGEYQVVGPNFGGVLQPLPTVDVERIVPGPLTRQFAAGLPPAARSGSHYAIMRTHDNDVAPYTPNDDPRCELNGGNTLPINTYRYIGWSMWFPIGFPPIPDWLGFVDMSGPPFTRSPVLALVVRTINGMLHFQWNRSRGALNQEGTGEIGTYIDTPWQMPVPLGRWVDIIYGTRISKQLTTDPTTSGTVEIWIDGVKQTFTSGTRSDSNRRIHTVTMFTTAQPEIYEVRMKNYRNRAQVTEAKGIGQPAPGWVTTCWDNLRIADTYTEADPGQGGQLPPTGGGTAGPVPTVPATSVHTNGATSATGTVKLPTPTGGFESGDVIVARVGSGVSTAVPTLPAGFSAIFANVATTGGSSESLWIKRYDPATDTSDWTFQWLTVTDWEVDSFVVRGADSSAADLGFTTPLTTNNTSAVTSVTSQAATSPTTNCLALLTAGFDPNVGVTFTDTVTSWPTKIHETQMAGGECIATWSRDVATAGTSVSGTVSSSDGSLQLFVTAIMFVRPSAANPTTVSNLRAIEAHSGNPGPGVSLAWSPVTNATGY
jgi:hypothetical protein